MYYFIITLLLFIDEGLIKLYIDFTLKIVKLFKYFKKIFRRYMTIFSSMSPLKKFYV